MPLVPDTNTFSLRDVVNATGGNSLDTAFTNSVAGNFDSRYGSKTMNPKTLLGFRNYTYSTVTYLNQVNFGGLLITAIDISADGSYIFLLIEPNAQAAEIRRYILYTKYNVNTISTTYQVLQLPMLFNGDTNGPGELWIHPDGKTIYTKYSNYIREITLTTENDLNSWIGVNNIQVNTGSFVIKSIWVSDEGYVCESEDGYTPIRTFSLTTPYSVITNGAKHYNRTRPAYTGLEYNLSGTSFFVLSNFGTAFLERYNNGPTPFCPSIMDTTFVSATGSWDLSTTIVNKNALDFCFSDNRQYMYTLDGNTFDGIYIHQFGLPEL